MRSYLNTTGLLRHIYPKQLIWNIPNNDKSIYLTFDDGPTPGVTDLLLDILRKHDAKATFFCLGKNVKKHPSLFNQIVNEGHVVANHTWGHLNSREVKTDEYLRSIAKANQIIQSNLFRPPYGRIRRKEAKLISKNYKIIMWTVVSGDFVANQSQNDCLHTVQKYTKSGSIIVFHDSEKAAKKMLFTVPRILKYYQEAGYKFEAINENIF